MNWKINSSGVSHVYSCFLNDSEESHNEILSVCLTELLKAAKNNSWLNSTLQLHGEGGACLQPAKHISLSIYQLCLNFVAGGKTFLAPKAELSPQENDKIIPALYDLRVSRVGENVNNGKTLTSTLLCSVTRKFIYIDEIQGQHTQTGGKIME